MIGETWWCFLKHKTLIVGKEITFTFCATTPEQNNCTVLYETTVLWTLDLITFNGISNVLHWFLLTDLQMGTLVTFTLCIVTSEITETVYAVTKNGLLTLALTTQGIGTETSWICKQCTNDLWIYLGIQNLCFFKKMDWNVDGWFSTVKEMTYDVDLDMLHDEIKLNNEVGNFW